MKQLCSPEKILYTYHYTYSYYLSEHKKEIVKIEIVLCNTEIIPCFSDQIKHKNCNNMDFVLQQCKQHHQQLSFDWSHL